MTKSVKNLVLSAKQLWLDLNQRLNARNDRAVAAWGSALQYKRRYTNPDSAIAARQAN